MPVLRKNTRFTTIGKTYAEKEGTNIPKNLIFWTGRIGHGNLPEGSPAVPAILRQSAGIPDSPRNNPVTVLVVSLVYSMMHHIVKEKINVWVPNAHQNREGEKNPPCFFEP
jgi:hypothetical protein